MELLHIETGPFQFEARLEFEGAPETCSKFLEFLPFENKVIHSRWSGEAVWIPLGNFGTGLEYENHTCHPSRGDVLLYPGGYSETEILFTYGSASFASKMGPLAGNHFLTLTKGHDQLAEMGRLVLWEGAQKILFHKP